MPEDTVMRNLSPSNNTLTGTFDLEEANRHLVDLMMQHAEESTEDLTDAILHELMHGTACFFLQVEPQGPWNPGTFTHMDTDTLQLPTLLEQEGRSTLLVFTYPEQVGVTMDTITKGLLVPAAHILELCDEKKVDALIIDLATPHMLYLHREAGPGSRLVPHPGVRQVVVPVGAPSMPAGAISREERRARMRRV